MISLHAKKNIVMGFGILGLDFVVSQMMNCHKSTISLLGGERLGFFFSSTSDSYGTLNMQTKLCNCK